MLDNTLLPPDARVESANPFEQISVKLAQEYPDLILMTADLSPFTDLTRVAQASPKQFLDVGMAEQNLMCIAGGLAKCGFMPIATTFASYASRRAFDQVVMCLGTGPSRGVVMGFAPGIASSARVHHQATDDLAMMRAVPNAIVLDPADWTETEAALRKILDRDGIGKEGLIYIRAMRGAVRQYFDSAFRFEFGQAVQLQAPTKSVGLISSGYATGWVIDGYDEIADAQSGFGHLHVGCLKPAPTDDILNFVDGLDVVVTVENHNVVGGLGSLVAETVTTEGLSLRVVRHGLSDWSTNGDIELLKREHRFDPAGLGALMKEIGK